MCDFREILAQWIASQFASLVGMALISVLLVHTWARKPVMRWTCGDQVPAQHPLLEVKQRHVRYLGESMYPLPLKFALFEAGTFYLFFGTLALMFTQIWDVQASSFSLVVVLELVGLQAILVGLVGIVFRRLQPYWLKKHLLTLPENVQPPPRAGNPVTIVRN